MRGKTQTLRGLCEVLLLGAPPSHRPARLPPTLRLTPGVTSSFSALDAARAFKENLVGRLLQVCLLGNKTEGCGASVGHWSLTSPSLSPATLTLTARAVCLPHRQRSGTLSQVPSSASWLTGNTSQQDDNLLTEPQNTTLPPCTVDLETPL